LCLAFDDDNKIVVADRFNELGQPIGHDANAIDVVDPFARLAWIGPLLNKLFFALAILENKTAVRVSIFVAFDPEQQCAAFVVIGIYRYAHPPRLDGGMIFAVLRRRPR